MKSCVPFHVLDPEFLDHLWLTESITPAISPLESSQHVRCSQKRPVFCRVAYVANLDAFGGNSGSGVFQYDVVGNAATNVRMIGLLISGGSDFVTSSPPSTRFA